MVEQNVDDGFFVQHEQRQRSDKRVDIAIERLKILSAVELAPLLKSFVEK